MAFPDAADQMWKVITQLKEGRLDSISFPLKHTQLGNPSPKTAIHSLQANPLVDSLNRFPLVGCRLLSLEGRSASGPAPSI